MELYKEIFIYLLEKERVEVNFPNLQIDASKLVELECYNALLKIKAIIEDDELDDKECFIKIEAVVRILELLGSDDGFRHDF